MTGHERVTLLRKLSRFDWEERRCLIEALLLLPIAAIAIRILPLRWLGKIASAGPFGTSPASSDRNEVLIWMVGWAVDQAACRSPLRALCFEQGLTAQVMLRRRGIDATLFYGVGHSSARPLHAHVWIETEQFSVIGAPDPGGFAILATWPEGRRAIWADCVT